MRKLFKYVIYICCLLIVPLCLYSAPNNSSSLCIEERIKLGEQFILDKLAKDQFNLSCKQYPPDCHPCPFPESGVTETMRYSVEALGNNLPLWAKNKIIDTLVKRAFYHFTLAGPFYGPAWAYSYQAPSHLWIADNTAFAFIALDRLGYRLNISAFNKLYSPADNVYKTAETNRPLDFFYALAETEEYLKPITEKYEKDLGLHSEVNAAVWWLFHERGLDYKINYDFIAKAQSPEGFWYDFDWDKYYSTYVNMKLLCATHKLPDRVAKGIEFLKTAQLKDGSWGNSYYTGLALNTLLSCNYNSGPTVERGIQYLISQQSKSGDWVNKSVIWYYVAGYLFNPDRPFCRFRTYDNYNILSTSFAVQAFKEYLKAHPEKNCLITNK